MGSPALEAMSPNSTVRRIRKADAVGRLRARSEYYLWFFGHIHVKAWSGRCSATRGSAGPMCEVLPSMEKHRMCRHLNGPDCFACNRRRLATREHNSSAMYIAESASSSISPQH
ncbi:hypothetical protein OSTOST_20563, partial [Ostertagia ostertagi]